MDDAPRIDYDRLDLPSKGITLGHLLALHPPVAGFFYENIAGDLDGMLHLECQFALQGFLKALGNRPTPSVDEVDELSLQPPARAELEQLYTKFRVADGPATAQELINRVEGMGAAQAAAFLGRAVSAP